MKLSTRLAIIVLCSTLGTLVLLLLNMQSLRNALLHERQDQITTTLNLAAKQVQVYIDLEKLGKLSRAEAQSRAKEAISGLRSNDDTYVFVRDLVGTTLVHPDPRKEGVVDPGSKMADGRTTLQVYLDALSQKNSAVVEIMTKRPGGDRDLLKLNGVYKIPEWGWILGFGLFADDIEQAFWQNMIRFLLIAAVIFVFITFIAIVMARKIYLRLGGEPAYAADMAKAIANGNLAADIKVNTKDNDSLMASLKVMQMKLKNIVGAIQDNASTLNEQVHTFETNAQLYSESKDEGALADLLRIVKKLSRTADVLNKSVSRFKA